MPVPKLQRLVRHLLHAGLRGLAARRDARALDASAAPHRRKIRETGARSDPISRLRQGSPRARQCRSSLSDGNRSRFSTLIAAGSLKPRRAPGPVPGMKNCARVGHLDFCQDKVRRLIGAKQGNRCPVKKLIERQARDQMRRALIDRTEERLHVGQPSRGKPTLGIKNGAGSGESLRRDHLAEAVTGNKAAQPPGRDMDRCVGGINERLANRRNIKAGFLSVRRKRWSLQIRSERCYENIAPKNVIAVDAMHFRTNAGQHGRPARHGSGWNPGFQAANAQAGVGQPSHVRKPVPMGFECVGASEVILQAAYSCQQALMTSQRHLHDGVIKLPERFTRKALVIGVGNLDVRSPTLTHSGRHPQLFHAPSAFALERTRATTLCPSAMALATISRPVAPVAPNTRISFQASEGGVGVMDGEASMSRWRRKSPMASTECSAARKRPMED